MHGVEATRGVVLLTKSGFVGPSSVDTLELKASLPHRVKPDELPWAACAVLSSDEAVLADLAGSSRQEKSSESVRGVSFQRGTIGRQSNWSIASGGCQEHQSGKP